MSQPSVPKKTIAVDVDDVLAQHIEAFIKHSNENHGTNFSHEDYQERWSLLWGLPQEEVEQRAQIFLHPDIVGNFSVIEDAAAALHELKRNYNLVVVTARPKQTLSTTHKWVEQEFPNIFSAIHFVPVWDPGPKKTKAEICKEIGAEYLIDDLVRHCNLAAETGIKAILFRRIKWEQPEEVHPDIIEVENWKEVLSYFDAESRRSV